MRESIVKDETSAAGREPAEIHETGSKTFDEELGLPPELIGKYRTFPQAGHADERTRSWKLCLDFMVAKCFEMIEGADTEAVSSISKNLVDHLKAEPRPVFNPRSRLYFKQAFEALERQPWKWKEWEYWKAIFSSLGKAPAAISRYWPAAPEPLDSQNQGKDRPERGTLSKIGAGRKHDDPKVRAYSEKENIFGIFILTMLSRAWILGVVRLWEQARFPQMKYIYEPLDDRDDDWMAMAENLGNPWRYPFQPRVPGLELTVTTNWDEFDMADDAEEQFQETIGSQARSATRQILENRSARKTHDSEKRREAALDLVLPKCFQMTSGLPSEAMDAAREILRNQVEPLSENYYLGYAEELYPLVEHYEWTWRELDFWAPIFQENQAAPAMLYATDCCCSATLTPSQVIGAVDLDYAQAVLPITKGIKSREALLRHLGTNRYDFGILCRNAFRDGILPLGNCSEANRESIFKLFLFTLVARVRVQLKLSRLQALGIEKYSFYRAVPRDDEKWMGMAERADNPWRYPYQPRMPGLQVILDTDLDDKFYGELKT